MDHPSPQASESSVILTRSPRVTDVSEAPLLPKLGGSEDVTIPTKHESNNNNNIHNNNNNNRIDHDNDNDDDDEVAVRLTPNSSMLAGKVYKLDQAKEILVPSLSPEPQSPHNEERCLTTTTTTLGISDDDEDEEDHNYDSDDDDDDDDDESSFFTDPNHLPSPKSASRKYSWSGPAVRRSSGRESDASLSLSSDDDDDNDNDNNNTNRPSLPQRLPQQRDPNNTTISGNPDDYRRESSRRHRLGSGSSNNNNPHESSSSAMKAPVADLQAPQHIVRMHSFSSLLSTASSQNSDDDDDEEDDMDVGGTNAIAHPHHLPLAPPESAGSNNNNNNYHEVPLRSTDRPWTSRALSEHTLQYSEDGSSSHNNNNVFSQSINAAASSEGGGAPHLPQSSGPADHHHRMGNPSTGGNNTNNNDTINSLRQSAVAAEAASRQLNGEVPAAGKSSDNGGGDGNFQVYWQRWIMLFYMSFLNLLSDWTCYSVAPIAVMSEEAFGKINPELLVTVFLGANAITTMCEPIILSRLGLRRTVIFGALLLMGGSIVKSGGMPPIIHANIEKGHGVWQVYLGFFLVGLSQPLYQCTPALLSASWFPERERTMATGVALNANQLGIGFAFVFGTLLVADSDDIPNYFGLLSILSTIVFLGTLMQFDDAPPTPPSDTARVMRGTLPPLAAPDWLVQSVRGMTAASTNNPPATSGRESSRRSGGKTSRTSKKSRKKSQRSSSKSSSAAGATSGINTNNGSMASSSSTRRRNVAPVESSSSRPPWEGPVSTAPSPMMPGPVGSAGSGELGLDVESSEQASQATTTADDAEDHPMFSGGAPPGVGSVGNVGAGGYPYPNFGYGPPPPGIMPPHPSAGYPGGFGGGQPYAMPPPQPVWDPHYQQWTYPPMPPPQYFYNADPNYYNSYQNNPLPAYPTAPSMVASGGYPYGPVPGDSGMMLGDEGAEPVLRMTPHHLDIDIRDDQVMRSIRACLRRPGFIHALVSFTVSGIVINTLSTFMDYLVRLNGVGREYTGIVGGSFQFCIMISSLIIGKITDSSRAYYTVTIGMLVLGAFGLAECGVSLDGDRGTELRWSLVVVAILVGPLQPVSTELGVEVVYPLSENTVLVIQQLFSNLLSAMFIPVFKAMKDIGSTPLNEGDANYSDSSYLRPEYTFSFYVLIVLHAAATVCFATFNGRYLRFEHELDKKAQEEARKQQSLYGDDLGGHRPLGAPVPPPAVV